MKISIGSDHRGINLKTFLITTFSDHVWHDVGTHTTERVDYPNYAQQVCTSVLNGSCQRGVLICGTGVGMAMAANRHPPGTDRINTQRDARTRRAARAIVHVTVHKAQLRNTGMLTTVVIAIKAGTRPLPKTV